LNEKSFAGVFSVVVIVLVLLPLSQNLRSQPRDCFPFSYYPMFSARRSEVVTLRFLVATDKHGKQTPLPYWVLGRGGMNQIRKQITRAVKNGEANSLCRKVALNVGQRKSRRYTSATKVTVVTAKFRLSDYVRGEGKPTSWSVEAESPIRRSPM